jgi:hypothetical protein
MRRAIIITFGLIVLFLVGINQAFAVSKAGVLFLTLPAGARAAGMGETFVAVADDATATHWNPGGLGAYPLTSTWIEYKTDGQFKLKSIALLKNDLPEENYKKYDVWAINSSDLLTWKGKKWVNYDLYSTTPGESIERIIFKITQEKDPEKSGKMVQKVAFLNNAISKDSLERIKAVVLKSLPPDYQKKDVLDSLFKNLLDSWDKCLLNQQVLSKLGKETGSFLADTNLKAEEIDKISLYLETCDKKALDQQIKIPLNLLFTDSLTAIGTDEKNLWVGTKSGLFMYDGKSWKRFGQDNGLLSEYITAIVTSPAGAVWVGTDMGIAKYEGGRWKFETSPSGLKDNFVIGMVVERENKLWVATRKGLASFDGTKWETGFKYTVKVGDDLDKIIQRFTGSELPQRIEAAKTEVKGINHLQQTKELTPNQKIEIPYYLGINSEITALAVDDLGNIWVGTQRGVLVFAQDKWVRWGYKLYTSQPGETVDSVAQKFLRTKNKERIEILSQNILEYNELSSKDLSANQKIYVYYNATGSKILSLFKAGGGKVYMGTEFGTLKFDGSSWSRYYHSGLEKAKTNEIIYKDGEIWFGTEEGVVIFAHAKREMTFMHTNLLPEFGLDLYYEYLSYAQHLEGWGTVGGNITFLSYGEIPITSELGPEPQGSFQSYEVALTFSYGTKLSRRLAGGLNVKIIHSHLAQQGYRSPGGATEPKGTGNSFALDLGALYETPIKKLTLGAALTNLGPDISYSDFEQGDPLPTNLGLGFAYRLFDTPFNRLSLVGDANIEMVEKELIENVGFEYWYGSFVALRAGYLYDRVGQRQATTLGAGLKYSVFRFDFAYIPASKDDVLTNTMRFSLTGRF